MGLIIKDKLQKMIKGYPTVSDKYNVLGGISEDSSNAIKFGDLVMFGSTTGYYKKAVSLSAVTAIAGFALGTNVKLAEGFASDEVQINKGEAFNLLKDGYIAIELDAGATEAQIVPNAKVAVILATGKVTTIDKEDSSEQTPTTLELPGVVLTGEYETQGSNFVVEAYVR